MRMTIGRKLPESASRGRARCPYLGNAEDTRARGWTVLIPRQRADLAPAPALGVALAASAVLRIGHLAGPSPTGPARGS